ncbi:MAG: interleukin-like EMT inducer domain-containing protein [Cyanobacteriota bacterium]|nr:interleukin-like EMT inducer domain-containing protein [Cyanobacteriota bacterium]
MTKPITLEVASVGYTSRDRFGIPVEATICKDGESIFDDFPFEEGLAVAVFDESSGEVVERKIFNTAGTGWTQEQVDEQVAAFAQLIDALPLGRIVAIAVKGGAVRNWGETLTETASSACTSLGMKGGSQIAVSQSWAAIGMKGEPPGTATESGPSYEWKDSCSRTVELAQIPRSQPKMSSPQQFFRTGGYRVSLEGDRIITGFVGSKEAFFAFQLEHGWWQMQPLQIADVAPQTAGVTGMTMSGDRALVGTHRSSTAPGENSMPSEVFAWRWQDGKWQQVQKLQNPSLQPSNGQEAAVVMNRDWAIVTFTSPTFPPKQTTPGEGTAWIFKYSDNDGWEQKQELGQSYISAAMDGSWAFLTSAEFSQGIATGKTEIFKRQDGQWQRQQEQLPYKTSAFGNLNNRLVDISGNWAIILHLDESKRVCLLHLEGGQWVVKQTLEGGDFSAVAIDGDRAIVGISNVQKYRARADVYRLSEGQWQWRKRLETETPNRRIVDVDLSGNVAAIGMGSNQRGIYMFDLSDV